MTHRAVPLSLLLPLAVGLACLSPTPWVPAAEPTATRTSRLVVTATPGDLSPAQAGCRAASELRLMAIEGNVQLLMEEGPALTHQMMTTETFLDLLGEIVAQELTGIIEQERLMARLATQEPVWSSEYAEASSFLLSTLAGYLNDCRSLEDQ